MILGVVFFRHRAPAGLVKFGSSAAGGGRERATQGQAFTPVPGWDGTRFFRERNGASAPPCQAWSQPRPSGASSYQPSPRARRELHVSAVVHLPRRGSSSRRERSGGGSRQVLHVRSEVRGRPQLGVGRAYQGRGVRKLAVPGLRRQRAVDPAYLRAVNPSRRTSLRESFSRARGRRGTGGTTLAALRGERNSRLQPRSQGEESGL